MPDLQFTVDSALLKELGERLVGKPHIALAELCKNGYDADARQVTIHFDPDNDRIEILDNGVGMNFEEFKNFWMRIGTTHKEGERTSRRLGRPMTGSKGVGRLAVQFLAKNLTITTVSKLNGNLGLEATVDWNTAVKAGDLTEAKVSYKILDALPFSEGTRIELTGLKNTWNKDDIKELAGQLWWLQPPFRSPSSTPIQSENLFQIEFLSPQRELEIIFNDQMRAILGIWTARLVGKNEKGKVILSLEFSGDEVPQKFEYLISNFPHNNKRYNKKINLNYGDFEIRIYTLERRQPSGIKVGEARNYFWRYGGVHVYDGGFRLPYYGTPDNDWLQIEFDHSHRRFVSELLPNEIQQAYAHTQRLNFLPTLGRVFAVVNVNTSIEPDLNIMITRDRLAESIAFDDLKRMVRYAFDLYAYEEGRRQYQIAVENAPIEPTSQKFERIEEVLETYREDIPAKVYKDIVEQVQDVSTAVAATQEKTLAQLSLLGPLATAGISALAYQHELKKQFTFLEGIIDDLSNTKTTDIKIQRKFETLRSELIAWLERARATNQLFDYLNDADNTKQRQRFRASKVVNEVVRQSRFLSRGIDIQVDISPNLFLPEASFAEWCSIFQNIFTNAFNAMLDSEIKILYVNERNDRNKHEILIQDTGYGIEIEDSEKLFEPFERESKISPERMALGYGGTGLGLTIVRLLAERIGCKVGFSTPDKYFKTAFTIAWRETRS